MSYVKILFLSLAMVFAFSASEVQARSHGCRSCGARRVVVVPNAYRAVGNGFYRGFSRVSAFGVPAIFPGLGRFPRSAFYPFGIAPIRQFLFGRGRRRRLNRRAFFFGRRFW